MMRIPLCLLSVMLLIVIVMASLSETRGTATQDGDTPTVVLREAPLVRFRGANSPSPEQPGSLGR